MHVSSRYFLCSRPLNCFCFAILLISLNGCATRLLLAPEPAKQTPTEVPPTRFNAELSALYSSTVQSRAKGHFTTESRIDESIQLACYRLTSS